MIALTFIKGPQVNGWVEGILQALEQLNPIEDNIEYTYIDFLVRFEEQYADSTKQETAQASLNQLKFKFPHINQYISNFETLARKAGYSIGSRESMNFFLKGLNSAPDIMERVVDKNLTNYYDLKAKAILVVKNRQLLQAMRNDANTLAFQKPFQCFDNY
jgi:hypothetical protein